MEIALLTGGGDKPYALGMANALANRGVKVDFIGSDDLATPDLLSNPLVRFLNLRGAQGSAASAWEKIRRILVYYMRLLKYSVTARPKIFHILWNNKFQLFDRTLLMLLYKVTGGKIVLTIHNVNAAQRDGNDNWMNRTSLKMQYDLADHLFVHTERMKKALELDFGVSDEKVSVIPFGINNTIPTTSLSKSDARNILNLKPADKVLLFFGNIAPYKGLEHLVAAFCQLAQSDEGYRLIIAGRPKQNDQYWATIHQSIEQSRWAARVVQRIEYIPDEETEVFFKAADVLVLPYTYVFQSGVLFLGYSFGLPAVATNVGSMMEEIVEGQTGFVAQRGDPVSLAAAIKRCFDPEFPLTTEERREAIKAYANRRYSWSKVGEIITRLYSELLHGFAKPKASTPAAVESRVAMK